jgi:hypothetical protein
MDQTFTHPTFRQKVQIRIPIGLLLCFLLVQLPLLSWGQTTYTWTGQGGNTDWTTSGNWNPSRTLPAPTDVIVFSTAGTLNITNVPTEVIGQLTVSGSAIVNLASQPLIAPATTNLITIAGGSGTDLQVLAGSELNIVSTINLGIRLLAGTNASISGSMTFSTGTVSHTLDATDAGAIVFSSGAVFTQNCDGNVFTSTGTNNTVVFSSGSRFIARNGASPFGSGTPSKVLFQTGSLYSHQHGGAVSLSGRTFADFEMNSAAYNSSNVGTNVLNVDNLTVTAATNFGINLTGGINIRGNLTVNGGNLSLSPAAANNLQFNGTGIQAIGGSGGTISVNGNTNLVIATGSTLEIRRDLTAGGSLTVNGTLRYSSQAAQSLTIAGNLSGSGSIDMSGGSLGHVLNLGGALNSTGSLVTSPSGSSTVHYNGNVNQQVFASANYSNLTVSGHFTTTKTLQGSVTVSRDLRLYSCALQTDGQALTVNGSSFIYEDPSTGFPGKLAMNSTAGAVSLQNVRLSAGGQLGGGAGAQPGTVSIGGSLEVVDGGVIDAVNLTVQGPTQVSVAGRSYAELSITSAAGSRSFGDFAAYTGFRNDANAPLTIRGNLTISHYLSSMGTGTYSFTGSSGTITPPASSPLFISSATFTGSYTATGSDLQISNPLVSAGGRFVNSTSAFPLVLPGSAGNATRAFNNSTLAFVNKFDRLSASAGAGNAVSATGTDLVFSRGTAGGSVYAVRTRDLSPAPTAAIIRFTGDFFNFCRK